jgi:hypothetical protein
MHLLTANTTSFRRLFEPAVVVATEAHCSGGAAFLRTRSVGRVVRALEALARVVAAARVTLTARSVSVPTVAWLPSASSSRITHIERASHEVPAWVVGMLGRRRACISRYGIGFAVVSARCRAFASERLGCPKSVLPFSPLEAIRPRRLHRRLEAESSLYLHYGIRARKRARPSTL